MFINKFYYSEILSAFLQDKESVSCMKVDPHPCGRKEIT
jgi:hypothetical protein